jgi:hypothetical protein
VVRLEDPLRTLLTPGESVTHRGIWTLYSGVLLRPNEAVMQEVVDELGLMTEGMPL